MVDGDPDRMVRPVDRRRDGLDRGRLGRVRPPQVGLAGVACAGPRPSPGRRCRPSCTCTGCACGSACTGPSGASSSCSTCRRSDSTSTASRPGTHQVFLYWRTTVLRAVQVDRIRFRRQRRRRGGRRSVGVGSGVASSPSSSAGTTAGVGLGSAAYVGSGRIASPAAASATARRTAVRRARGLGLVLRVAWHPVSGGHPAVGRTCRKYRARRPDQEDPMVRDATGSDGPVHPGTSLQRRDSRAFAHRCPVRRLVARRRQAEQCADRTSAPRFMFQCGRRDGNVMASPSRRT